MRHALFVISLSALATVTAMDTPASAAPAPRRSQGPRVAKPLQTLLARTYRLHYARGYVYLGTTVGLRIVDLRNPSKPRPLGTLVIPGSVQGLHVDKTTAYVAAGPHGVVVADVSVKTRIKRLARIDTPGSANSVATEKNHLYVADGSFGVAVYDVTLPAKPKRLATVKTGCYTRDLAVHGRWIIVACSRKGLVTFRTYRSVKKKKGWPRPLYRLPLAGDARNLTFGPGRTLYVAAGEAGFHVIDARRPRRLRRFATAKVPDFAHGVSAWGNRLAVAAGEGGVHIYNCRRRNRPRRMSSYKSTPNRSANKVYLRRGLVLVAYDAAGLHVLKSAGRRLTRRAVFPPPPKKKRP